MISSVVPVSVLPTGAKPVLPINNCPSFNTTSERLLLESMVHY
jgi:hypothetical protein